MSRSNLRTGIEWGISFAAVYSGYVGLLWLIRGDVPFRAASTTVLEVVVAYCLAGLLGGALFGLLLPLGQRWLGAAFLGFVVALVLTPRIWT